MNTQMTPSSYGARFGVETREENKKTGARLYSPAVYDADGHTIAVSERRLSYGEAFVEAHEMAAKFQVAQ